VRIVYVEDDFGDWWFLCCVCVCWLGCGVCYGVILLGVFGWE